MSAPDDRQAMIRDRRVQYESAGLDVGDVAVSPVEQWHRWHDDAVGAELTEPNAMTVSTVDVHGMPDARIVLARAVDDDGFVFYTNYESAKSRQLAAAPVAAATFAWLDLHRQVRVRGAVERVGDAVSDAYFASRPRDSQLGAWASPQSAVLADRDELDRLVQAQRVAFESAERVPRPAQWGGWLIVPDQFEFWQGRPNRLHDRISYRLVDAEWRVERLAP